MMWEVFYTPHTDDETIGMAGSILRAHAAGRHTLVVLVTDNQPSARGQRLFPDDAFSQRRVEWTRAMAVLGVTKVECWELPEALMIHEPKVMVEEVLSRMSRVAQQYPVLHHHAVALHDVHVESSMPTPAHIVCAQAAMELRRLHPSIRVSLHYVYVYSEVPPQRTAPVVLHLSEEHWRTKVEALNCFKAGAGSVGYGYVSVPELFDGAAADPREFLMEVEA